MIQSKFKHKKSLGQHFLKSEITAKEIVDALYPINLAHQILEIGPGLGILSQFLLKLEQKIFFSEIDERVIERLEKILNVQPEQIFSGDFLKLNLLQKINGPFYVIGNFPYQISSQILFKILEIREQVPVVVGMFQKEMARRVFATHGNKEYGVITVLVQAYYKVEYLFELPPSAFDPPPRVESAVIKLSRKENQNTIRNIELRTIVKAGFNQRRKKLSNALNQIPFAKELLVEMQFADKRAEQLSIEDFILLSEKLYCSNLNNTKKQSAE